MIDQPIKKSFSIGETVLSHGLMLAPMAGVTDAPCRAVCRTHGADYTVTEMISAKALWYHDKKTAVLAHISTEEMHRRRGLALHCAAEMLKECAKRGITVHWDAQNVASRNMALKLGYETGCEYTVFMWKKNEEA